MTDEQRAAEHFVTQTLEAVRQSLVSRTVIACALVEVAGALMRQDVVEDPTRLSFYAEALEMLAGHVLGPLATTH